LGCGVNNKSPDCLSEVTNLYIQRPMSPAF
jgi:hypothetical protein